ncbi:MULTISPECIES: hypothetical protein [Pelosinus]|jgi:hypothetical protein|uniref:Uncharacterized protein n=1 Tax=Pelosinus fermentans B4 TaxID=1149862 RepID=I9LBI6_9FIRM|nr:MULTISPECIES: hypothetical protein [Pelosinus]EIW17789.1 hypothetical protein FB4_3832 [Pelosinus fermentans B4]EIW23751.1 hypothetical protein FA11_3834 [Pelosinus fermentans A11]OAM94674.1 hypothetical protein FR7_02694 [Pelosinus fermentans DSM 17108]SDR15120.1 hypothetical protein SAMN04515679_2808 [Pelosinus fermentans]
MSHDSSEKDSNRSFGAETSNSSFSGGFGLELLDNSVNGGFGAENPSSDYKSVLGREIAIESVGSMLDINTDTKGGIAGGAVYLGNMNRYFVNDSLEDICDTREIGNVQSWFERGSIVGSVVKAVTDLYNKYVSPEMKSVEKVITDIDNKIVAKIEEISSGGWDSPYRNIQLDGCIKGDMAEFDQSNVFHRNDDRNEIQLDSSAGEALKTGEKTEHGD